MSEVPKPADHRSPATLRSRVVTFLKGLAMGVADSVPGVSGGTIAVMAGIYEELIESLRNRSAEFRPSAVVDVFLLPSADVWLSDRYACSVRAGVGSYWVCSCRFV
jgi:hypothetical protein